MRLQSTAAAVSIATLAFSQPPTLPQPPTPSTDIRFSSRTGPLQLGVVGMVHGHVEGVLWADDNRDDITLARRESQHLFASGDLVPNCRLMSPGRNVLVTA